MDGEAATTLTGYIGLVLGVFQSVVVGPLVAAIVARRFDGARLGILAGVLAGVVVQVALFALLVAVL